MIFNWEIPAYTWFPCLFLFPLHWHCFLDCLQILVHTFGIGLLLLNARISSDWFSTISSFSTFTLFSTHCDCPATVHLIYTIENASNLLKNCLMQHKYNFFIIFFFVLFTEKNTRSSNLFLCLLNSILQGLSLKRYSQNNKKGLWSDILDVTSITSSARVIFCSFLVNFLGVGISG